MKHSEALHKARVYHDKAVTKQIEEDLQVMVAAVIGDYNLEITYDKDGFDPYPSCKHWEKTYCRCHKRHYRGYLHGRGYAWFGDSKIDIYCQVIASIVGNKIYLPYSALPHDETEEKQNG